MKHFRLKFNHGVEIGAIKAYEGHLARTGETPIFDIIREEMAHRKEIDLFLSELGHQPSRIIDTFFCTVGSIVGALCKVCPIWSLKLVARMMEAFAVFSYRSLAKTYPERKFLFLTFARTEDKHARYFKEAA